MHAASAEAIVVSDLDQASGDDLVVDFGPSHGLWVFMDDSFWRKLHNASPEDMVTAAGLQVLEVSTGTWTAPRFKQVAEGIAGQQWALYLRVLWEGTARAGRAVEVGRSLGVAAHVAEDLRSGDARFHGMPEEGRREVVAWAREAVDTVRREGLASLDAALRTVEALLPS